MMTSYYRRIIFSLATFFCLASGQMFTMDWGPHTGNGKYPFAQIEDSSNGVRRLAGETTCTPVGPKFQCGTNTTIRADDGAVTQMYVLTECKLDSQIKFDFRRAQECRCKTTVTRFLKDGTPTTPKMCPCLVCAAGFGDNPVSIDCSGWEKVTLEEFKEANKNDALIQAMTEVPDSMIINECSSLDCGWNCNGTCRLDCIESGDQCEYCIGNWTPPPGATGYYTDENGQAISAEESNAIGNFDPVGNATMVSTFPQTNTPTSASTLETTTDINTAITTITELPTAAEIPDITFVVSDFPMQSLTSFESSRATMSTIVPSDTDTDYSATSTTTTSRGSSVENSPDTPEPTKTTTKITTNDSTLSVQTVAPTFTPTTRLPTGEKTPTISPSEKEQDNSRSVIRFGFRTAISIVIIATITAGFLSNIVINQL